MDQDKKSLLYSVMLLSALSFVVMLLDWLFVTGTVHPGSSEYFFILRDKILSSRLHDHLWIIKLIYILTLCMICLLTSGNSDNDNRMMYVISALISCCAAS